MSEFPLNVPTAFADVAQLAEGLADRVDDERIMLYGPEPIPDGSTVRFEVLLGDQEPALVGTGQAIASIDGGDERPAVARYDIVLENLAFEGSSEAVYERMLAARSPEYAASRPTGQVAVGEEEFGEEIADVGAAAETHDVVSEAREEDSFEAETAIANMDPPEEAYRDDEQAAPAPEHDDEYADAGPTAEEDVDVVESRALEEAAEEVAFSEEDHEAGGTEEHAYEEPESASYADEGHFESAADIEPEEEEAHAADSAYASEEHEPTGEATAVVYEDEVSDEPSEAQEVSPEWQDASDTETAAIVSEEGIPDSAPIPEAPVEPAPFQLQPTGTNGSSLARPAVTPSWYPEAMPAPEPQPESGYFAYGGSLPVPQAPPRPELDPSLRIAPAPRPAPEAASADEGAYEDEADQGAAYQAEGDAGHAESYDEGAGAEGGEYEETGAAQLEAVEEGAGGEALEEVAESYEGEYEAVPESDDGGFASEDGETATAEIPMDEMEEFEPDD